jgi:microcystin-dependent protein
MSQPFIGEIRLFGGNFAPQGWEFCNGQTLSIAEFTVLFELIGTTYGGDGQTTFALPDLQGRLPVHQGAGLVLGQLGGEENHTLTGNEMPAHQHPGFSASSASSGLPNGNLPANTGADKLYAPGNAGAWSGYQSVGGNQPHNNLMPFACVSYIISLFGIFPSQS